MKCCSIPGRVHCALGSVYFLLIFVFVGVVAVLFCFVYLFVCIVRLGLPIGVSALTTLI